MTGHLKPYQGMRIRIDRPAFVTDNPIRSVFEKNYHSSKKNINSPNFAARIENSVC